MKVNGISGSAVIVVEQPLTLNAPAVALPGAPFTVLDRPIEPRLGALEERRAHADRTDRLERDRDILAFVQNDSQRRDCDDDVGRDAPAHSTPDSYPVSARATFTSANGDGSTSAIQQVAVPYKSLDNAFNNPGISDDAETSSGNLDGGGLSYSAQALAAAGPSLTPGASVTHHAFTFTWPNVPAGTPDNVTAGGQTIALSGAGTTLGFLGAGDYGSASGNGTIIYTDGSTQVFTLSFADWWASKPTSGGDILATMPYVNTSNGRRNQTNSVYYASVPLQQGKTVQYVTLPDISLQATQNHVAMHIFAIAIG